MTDEFIAVFINDRVVHARHEATLADAVGEFNPPLAADLLTGHAVATDGRGIAVDGSTPLTPGAIFRVFRPAGTDRPGTNG